MSDQKEIIYADGQCGCSRCGDPVDLDNWHECPFKSEIHQNYTECNCCSECQYQCSQDI